MAAEVLVPMDGSPQAKKALDHALSEHPEAEITVLHVIDPVEAGYAADPMGMDYWEGWYEFAEERAEALFEEVTELAEDRGRSVATVRESGAPARVIVDFADDHDIDHIVVGSHGRSGVARVLLGSVAESVVRRSPVPVTVVR